MKTNNYTRFNKPDIVIIYKKEDKIVIIGGSCPWDENVERTKYIPLAIELKALYQKKKCIIAELVKGATGTVTESMQNALEKLSKNIRKIMNNCQKATILGTVKICRQVFDGN